MANGFKFRGSVKCTNIVQAQRGAIVLRNNPIKEQTTGINIGLQFEDTRDTQQFQHLQEYDVEIILTPKKK